METIKCAECGEIYNSTNEACTSCGCPKSFSLINEDKINNTTKNYLPNISSEVNYELENLNAFVSKKESKQNIRFIKCAECGEIYNSTNEACTNCGCPKSFSLIKEDKISYTKKNTLHNIPSSIDHKVKNLNKSIQVKSLFEALNLLNGIKKNNKKINLKKRKRIKTSSNKRYKSQNSKKTINHQKSLVHTLSHIGETEGLGDFSLEKFFGGFNKKFSEREIVNTLFVGTETTTPLIKNVSTNYPEPWLCYRLIFLSVVFFYGFVFLFNQNQNTTIIPAIIFIGSFAVPISTLILFFELNLRRNVPLWAVFRLVLAGTILSFLITEILAVNLSSIYSSSGAWFAAILEEPAKLLALIILTNGKKKYPYILNGLLLGAAVGCGFAAFETSGYALRELALEDIESMIQVIQLRGILSPFMHIVWTAVAGGALWRIKKNKNFSLKNIQTKKFILPFSIMIICHALWNSPWQLPFMGKYIICGLLSWIIALSILNLGIKQIIQEKEGKEIFS